MAGSTAGEYPRCRAVNPRLYGPSCHQSRQSRCDGIITCHAGAGGGRAWDDPEPRDDRAWHDAHAGQYKLGNGNEKYTAEAFVLNLEDESVYQNVQIGSGLLANPGFAWYGAPRTYGFRVGFRY